MAQFAGKAVVTVEQLSVDDDTRADARSKGDDDEVLHATGHAVDHLAQGSGVGVVGQRHRDTAEPLAEHLSQRHHTVVSPRQVGGKLDGTVIIVAVGGADAHRLDLVDTAHLLDDGLQGLDTSVDVGLGRLEATGLDGGGCLDVAACVDNTKHGVRTSQVQADNVRLQNLLFIHSFMRFFIVLGFCSGKDTK